MYSRYGQGANDILALPFAIGMDVIRTGMEEDNFRLKYFRWVSGGYDKQMTYKEFDNKTTARHETGMSAEEIDTKLTALFG